MHLLVSLDYKAVSLKFSWPKRLNTMRRKNFDIFCCFKFFILRSFRLNYSFIIIWGLQILLVAQVERLELHLLIYLRLWFELTRVKVVWKVWIVLSRTSTRWGRGPEHKFLARRDVVKRFVCCYRLSLKWILVAEETLVAKSFVLAFDLRGIYVLNQTNSIGEWILDFVVWDETTLLRIFNINQLDCRVLADDLWPNILVEIVLRFSLLWSYRSEISHILIHKAPDKAIFLT